MPGHHAGMRSFCLLVEELESRPDDADRVAALARWLRAAGPDAAARACDWLVVDAPKRRRPARLAAADLAAAAAALAQEAGTPAWLFEAGRAAGTEAVEALALLLPWPQALDERARPTLAAWLEAWQAAAAQPDRARAIAGCIAALDDAVVRRWAARAACGLVRPLLGAWQWQRAWALAFDEDVQAVAWRWQGADAGAGVPRPHAFAPLSEAPEEAHDALLGAWRTSDAWAEPRWRGLRVQVVRQAAALAVWQRAGPLLNALLPPELLEAAAWPEPCAIEAVLVASRGGRAVAVAEVLGAGRRAEGRLHLVLTDWHRWHGETHEAVSPAQRRARLHARWPAPPLDESTGAFAAEPPPVFASPALRPPAGAALLRSLATAARDAGWSGLVLRRDEARWAVRSEVLRVRAVLLYVPSEALGATAAAAAVLAVAGCGFALWNRAPRSADEQLAAMAAAMTGEFLPAPPEAPATPALRLLPLARLPLALPNEELQRLQSWLRANAGQRFGGVHAVAPAQVFEIGFARLRASRRHRLGAVLEEARVLRWLAEAAPGSADPADALEAKPS
jgi:DNA ligase-1